MDMSIDPSYKLDRARGIRNSFLTILSAKVRVCHIASHPAVTFEPLKEYIGTERKLALLM
jgi:hypothetical protein